MSLRKFFQALCCTNFKLVISSFVLSEQGERKLYFHIGGLINFVIHYSVFLFSHYILMNILFSIQVMYKKDNQFWFPRKRVLGGEEMRGSSALLLFIYNS
jgi:hypothetical protein